MEKELRVLQVPCLVGYKEGIWVRMKILVWVTLMSQSLLVVTWGDLWSLGFLH